MVSDIAYCDDMSVNGFFAILPCDEPHSGQGILEETGRTVSNQELDSQMGGVYHRSKDRRRIKISSL